MVPCPISEYDIKVEGTVYPVFFTCHKICENEEMISILISVSQFLRFYISISKKIIQNRISAHSKFCDLKEIAKKVKIRSSRKLPDIQ